MSLTAWFLPVATKFTWIQKRSQGWYTKGQWVKRLPWRAYGCHKHGEGWNAALESLAGAHVPGVPGSAPFPCPPYLQSESNQEHPKGELNSSFLRAHQRGSHSLDLTRVPQASGTWMDLKFPFVSIRDSLPGPNMTPQVLQGPHKVSRSQHFSLLETGVGRLQKGLAKSPGDRSSCRNGHNGRNKKKFLPFWEAPASLSVHSLSSPPFLLPHRHLNAAAPSPSLSLASLPTSTCCS